LKIEIKQTQDVLKENPEQDKDGIDNHLMKMMWWYEINYVSNLEIGHIKFSLPNIEVTS